MKILIIIAKQGFRDEEYDIPARFFLNKGIAVDVASTEKGICTGKLGMNAEANLSLKDAAKNSYSAIVIVGGPGAKNLVGNSDIERIVAGTKGIISAICYAPVILAKAGFLKGKRATVWNGDDLERPILQANGATYVDEDVVVDGNIVTGNGPAAAREFAEKIWMLLNNHYS
jgi:protease I